MIWVRQVITTAMTKNPTVSDKSLTAMELDAFQKGSPVKLISKKKSKNFSLISIVV